MIIWLFVAGMIVFLLALLNIKGDSNNDDLDELWMLEDDANEALDDE